MTTFYSDPGEPVQKSSEEPRQKSMSHYVGPVQKAEKKDADEDVETDQEAAMKDKKD